MGGTAARRAGFLTWLVVVGTAFTSTAVNVSVSSDDPGGGTSATFAAHGLLGTSWANPGNPLSRLSFIENAGQYPTHLRFAYLSGRMTVGFADGSLLLHTRRPADAARDARPPSLPTPEAEEDAWVRVAFEGASPVVPEGRGVLPHRSNFYLGNDPARWRAGVRSVEEVVYTELYDGIDLRFRVADGLKYEYLLDAGVDPGTIRLRYEGAGRLTVTETGDLVVTTAAGEIRDTAPVAYQGSNPVPCAFALRDGSSVGFECRARDPGRPLVIDPLIYSTFLGGSGSDWGFAIAVDASGSAYVAGSSGSSDFPVTGRGYAGNNDPFVAKLDASGSALVYATFLGGWTYDEAYGLAIDGGGNAYITGVTTAFDFPTTPGAFDTTPSGSWDAFVAKLSPTGTILYSTYLGGNASGMDVGYGIAVDTTGRATVTGFAESPDFPTTPGAYDTTWNGDWDVFVTRLNPSGSALEFSTFLGSTYTDIGLSVALDTAGDVHLAGYTVSPDFPNTTASFDPSHNGAVDVFVAELAASGDALQYSGFLGGSGWEGNLWFYVIPIALAVDGAGNAYVAGHTDSPDFPVTAGAFDTSCGSDGQCDRYYSDIYRDGFVAKIDASGSTLEYATFLGGNRTDLAAGLAVGPGGEAYVTGTTDSADFPITPGAPNATLAGQSDVFVVRLDSSGSSVLHATFLGSSGWDLGDSIALDAAGNAYVTGYAHTGDFPTTPGAFDRTHPGFDNDAFVAKLSMEGPSLHTITVDTSPAGLEVVVNGTTTMAPHTFRCVDATTVTIAVPSPQGGPTARHVFRSWSDGGAQAHPITCGETRTYVASFDREVQVLFDTRPTGLELTIDGASRTSRVEYWWGVGSTHTFAVFSPQIAPQAVYRFRSWNDGGPQNRTTTVSLPATLVAEFEAVYRLTLESEHGSVSCDSPDCWYPVGATARVTVTSPVDGPPGTRYVFRAWSGDAAGTDASATVPMDGPRTLVAEWTTEHFVRVESVYGTVSGGGWHPSGATVEVSVSSTEVLEGGRRFRFAGWTGGPANDSPTFAILVDGPKDLTANWREVSLVEGSAWILAVTAVLGLLAVLALVLRRGRKGRGL